MTTSKKPTVSKVTNKKRVATPVKTQYLGDTDPAQFIHHNKTHRTMAEAFRGADYATPIWKFKSDSRLAMEFLFEMLLGGAIVAIPLFLLYSLLVWLGVTV